MVTIRCTYEVETDRCRYTVLVDGEYRGDYPDMETARIAARNLGWESPRSLDPIFFSDRLPWRKS